MSDIITHKTSTTAKNMGTRPYSSMDTVRTYLHEIGRVPLLSREEEIVYGKQVQQLMALLEGREVYKAELKRLPTDEEWSTHLGLTVHELQTLLKQGKHAKQKMIEANLRLVVAIAKKYQKRNMDFMDLIQEGTLGLERGVEKFDPTKGYKFSTYAYWWIRQAITRAIAQQSRTIRLPIHITEKLNKIKKIQRELTQKLGHAPSQVEIAKELELEPAQIREYLLMSRQPISLDMRVGDNQDTELQELLEDVNSSPDDYIAGKFMREDLSDLLAQLTEQQRQVINLRFGLTDGKELSLAKVGERLSISRERVRQLEAQALNHLRRNNSKFREYLAG